MTAVCIEKNPVPGVFRGGDTPPGSWLCRAAARSTAYLLCWAASRLKDSLNS
jgi:hypothetical protein